MTLSFDTNVLIYAVQDGAKAEIARRLIDRAILAGSLLPVQVLAEFSNVCRGKLGLDSADIAERVAQAAVIFQVLPTAVGHVAAAAHIAERYQLAYFDALICTVARGGGATTLFSEDMHDGARIEGLTIVNPFEPANTAAIDRLFA